MALLRKKLSQRRYRLRQSISAEHLIPTDWVRETGITGSVMIMLGFVVLCSAMLAFDVGYDQVRPKSIAELLAITALVMLISAAMGVYVYKFQHRIIKNNLRSFALAGLFLLLTAITKLSLLLIQTPSEVGISTGVIVGCAIILTIVYDTRFAIGMSMLFAIIIWLGLSQMERVDAFVTMFAGVVTCCFALREIRTRMKLLEVSITAATIVFITSALFGVIRHDSGFELLSTAGRAAFAVIVVGFVIQGILPLIEKVFHVATSMTLLDYSDASQPILRRLAMEAPGTYSHSLLIGAITEAAADNIGANGLLCRVGSYYHDIGKINKPSYFIENQMGAVSKHKELSPAMSQLIIIGHVKDGIEMAKEYKLPAVLRQFIEAHHGTTLIEYFYNEAKKRQGDSSVPAETDYRYPGPKPKTKEAAIVMLADTVEGAVRSLPEVTPTRIEAVVHNMAMKRLQDGQFDECDLTLRELSKIEASLTKSLTAHYHGRIAYPKAPDAPEGCQHHSIEKMS